MHTHYNTLHIPETASTEEIKSAYRSLAQKWHPDKNPEDRVAAERIFCLLNDAYAVLSDRKRRRQYDDIIHAKRSGAPRRRTHEEIATPVPSRTLGALLAERYRDDGDGMVTDITTQLQWLRFAIGQEWRRGDCVGAAMEFSWQNIFNATKTFNQNGHVGYRDWRIPTKEELQTLIYCSTGQPHTWNETGCPCEGDCGSPTIHALAFPNTPAEWFWSSTTYEHDQNYAWFVYFSLGGVYAGNKNHERFVRLVRNVSPVEK